MNKYLIVVVVSVLALTGCNKEEEKLLADCYAKSEAIATEVYPEFDYEREDVIEKTMEEIEKREQDREMYGVSREGYITQAGRDRCKRLIELGEFPNLP